MSNSSIMANVNAIQAGLWQGKTESEAESHASQARELDVEISDEILMQQCQKGNQESLETLYQRYYRPILLFILRIVQNRDMAEDLVQETFIRVFNKRDTWQPNSKFSSWLYRIARNLCIDEKRRYWNRLVHMDSQYSNYNSEYGQSSFLDSVEDGNGDARDNFAAKCDEETIKSAINQLSPEQREVIILNKYQGMSYIEISEILDATPESIKQRAYRAHLKLRQILEPLLQDV